VENHWELSGWELQIVTLYRQNVLTILYDAK